MKDGFKREVLRSRSFLNKRTYAGLGLQKIFASYDGDFVRLGDYRMTKSCLLMSDRWQMACISSINQARRLS